MASTKKAVKLTTSQKKVIEYRHMQNIITNLLLNFQGGEIQLDMIQLMTYLLTPVPYYIGTADSFLAKTDHANTMNVQVPSVNVLTTGNGNALFCYLKDTPDNLKQFTEKLCGDVLVSIGLGTDASLTADPGVASSIPALSHTFVEIDYEIISMVILLPSAESFKKDNCCQLQA